MFVRDACRPPVTVVAHLRQHRHQHVPQQFERRQDEIVALKKASGRSFTHVEAEAIGAQMRTNPRVTAITAAIEHAGYVVDH